MLRLIAFEEASVMRDEVERKAVHTIARRPGRLVRALMWAVVLSTLLTPSSSIAQTTPRLRRVLTRCLRMAELEKGINRIRQARAAPDCLTHDPEVSGSNPVPATQSVGRNLRLG